MVKNSNKISIFSSPSYLYLINYCYYRIIKMMSQLQNFYEAFKVKQVDKRSEEDKISQKKIVQNISKLNQKILNIQLTPRKKVKYPISKLQRIDLGDGQYCFITDNRVQSNQTIFTIHGVPGNYTEWAGIEAQMNGKYRWINFMIPGFDGEDERRGTYKGDRKSLRTLFLRLVTRLGLKRIIICAHSFGTTLGFDFAREYPHLIQGNIIVGGMTKYWQFGQTLIYKRIVCDHGYYKDQWKEKRLFDIQEERKKIYERYTSQFKEGTLQMLKETQFFGFLKLSLQDPTFYDSYFKNCNLEVNMLKVNIYGKQDPIIFTEIIQGTIYHLLFDQTSYVNSSSFKTLRKKIKKPLQERLFAQFGIKVEGQRIQEYFNFIFDDTGHNIHRRRPTEMSKIIQIYLVSLQVIYEAKILENSKL